MHHRAFAPAARPTDAIADLIMARSKVRDAAIDRAASQAGRCRRRRDAAVAVRHGFVGSEQSPSTFGEKLLRLLPALTYVFYVDHQFRLAHRAASRPAIVAILILRSSP